MIPGRSVVVLPAPPGGGTLEFSIGDNTLAGVVALGDAWYAVDAVPAGGTVAELAGLTGGPIAQLPGTVEPYAWPVPWPSQPPRVPYRALGMAANSRLVIEVYYGSDCR